MRATGEGVGARATGRGRGGGGEEAWGGLGSRGGKD